MTKRLTVIAILALVLTAFVIAPAFAANRKVNKMDDWDAWSTGAAARMFFSPGRSARRPTLKAPGRAASTSGTATTRWAS